MGSLIKPIKENIKYPRGLPSERSYGVRSLSFEERKVLEQLVQALPQVLRVQANEVFQQGRLRQTYRKLQNS